MSMSIIQFPIDVLAWIAAYSNGSVFRHVCKAFYRATKTRTFRLKQISIYSDCIGRQLVEEKDNSYETLTVKCYSLFPEWRAKQISLEIAGITAAVTEIDREIAKYEKKIEELRGSKQSLLKQEKQLQKTREEIPFITAKFNFRYERRKQHANPRLPTLHRCSYLDEDARTYLLSVLKETAARKSINIRAITGFIHPTDIREYDVLAFHIADLAYYLYFIYAIKGYLYASFFVKGKFFPRDAESFIKNMSITTKAQVIEIYDTGFGVTGYLNSSNEEIIFKD